MINKSRELKRRRPQVDEVREFLEIVRDFTDPREVIREAISNSIDWGATEIKIIIKEDVTLPDEELIIEIFDNGLGLNEERLSAFFDLGRTTSPDDSCIAILNKIGYKGHGTKTYFNSRQIEVESNSSNCTVYAVMVTPLQKLMAFEIPEYDYDIQEKSNEKTYTKITIRGYNMNKNKRDFAQNVLKDYIFWFTRFGSVEKEFGILDNKDKKILLQ